MREFLTTLRDMWLELPALLVLIFFGVTAYEVCDRMAALIVIARVGQ